MRSARKVLPQSARGDPIMYSGVGLVARDADVEGSVLS
jgi:hypothetical protein